MSGHPDEIASGDDWVHFLDRMHIGAFTVDMDRRITSINRTLGALLGLREPDALGRSCREAFRAIPCRETCPLEGGWEQCGEGQSVEILDAANNRRYVVRTMAPILGENRDMVGCLLAMQDQPPLADLINRVNHDARTLNIILDNMDIGIFTMNRGGYVTFFNRAAELVTGYDRERILGQPGVSLFQADHGEELVLHARNMSNGEPRSSSTMNVISPDGETVPVQADYIPLKNERGGFIGCLVTLQDLTLVERLDQAITDRYTFHNMIGKDPSMQRIFEMVRVVAACDATVLIEGATGTGKDLLAKVIHSASLRSHRPMVKLNCAAIPENLLESELFGYVRGAFSGADRNKPGRFQLADKGTIFLDEIGDLPLSLQAKLLRVLDDREFYPLGGRNTVKVDVRIISATNRGLEKLVEQGYFREDLFYRLNVMHIELPRLVDRRSDLPLLIRNFLRKLCAGRKAGPLRISPDAMKYLLDYDYPGNVRELENILEHAVIVCQEDEIKPRHLHGYLQKRISLRRSRPSAAPDRPAGASFPREREEIVVMLQRYNWHRTKTATAMGIDRTTLWRRMKRLGL